MDELRHDDVRDAELVDHARSGDAAALNTFVKRHQVFAFSGT